MTPEILLLLVLLGATLAAFVTELLPVEVTALALLSVLLLTGIVSVQEALSGFSNEAVVTVGAMFALSHAVAKTGLLETAAEWLSRAVGPRKWLGIALFLSIASLLSGFLNNTAVVAILIPLAIEFCRRFGLAPARILLPLSYASIFGGTLTLIGTSTNLLVSSLAADGGEEPLGMFEFAPLGAVFLVVGIVYVVVLGPKLLPDRDEAPTLVGKYQMAPFLTELRVAEGSKLIGQTVRDADLNRRYDVMVLAVLRGDERIVENLRQLPLAAGDLLVARGTVEGFVRLRGEQGLALLSDKVPEAELAAGDQILAEALVPPNSSLIGRTLQELDFRRRHQAFVLAIRRLGATLHQRLAETPLRFSDTLLLVTTKGHLDELRRSEEILVTSELDLTLHRHRLWWLVFLVLPVAMTLAALGVVPIVAGALAACVVLLAVGAITPRETYRAVDWSVLFFIAAFVPLGDAMFNTGAADLVGSAILFPVRWLPAELAPWAAVSLLYLGTSLLTEVLTNNAAAILLTPIAIGMSHALGVDARPLVMAVCFAASASFMTPTGYQTNMMVYGPGNYRYRDYLRLGAPLNLIFWIVASLLIPRIWGF